MFGGGRLVDTGRDSAHASISRVSHPTRFAEIMRGFGRSFFLTKSCTVVFDTASVSATFSRLKMIGIMVGFLLVSVIFWPEK